ncbi:MAG: T9SS type A sorting domain-containing protein [Chitinophagaceae bacterium]|nr:T9SS type A sorting domain-containing protein [Chitinophagaceae bacterium]
MQIFPNPVKGENLSLGVTNPKAQAMDVKIYDINGRQVFQQTINSNASRGNYQVPVAKLAAGNYTVVINNGEEEIRKQFVKN